MIVERRPDGVVQIRRRPVWRALMGPVPGAMLGLLLLQAAVLAALVMALVCFPMLLLLVAGLGALLLSAVRFAWQEERPRLRRAQHPPPRPHPPRDAA